MSIFVMMTEEFTMGCYGVGIIETRWVTNDTTKEQFFNNQYSGITF